MKLRLTLCKHILIVILSLAWSLPGRASEPYKTYVLKKHGKWDIICEPYTVKRGDHLWQILRRKGCIAERDFPRFVAILKRFNPSVRDVNRIYPDQKILIPLKQTKEKEVTPDGSPRYITIPIIPDILSYSYKVRDGDCLSKIVTAHLGLRMQQIPEGYFESVKKLNPHIKDMDNIYAGQRIRLPDLASKSQSLAIDIPVPVGKWTAGPFAPGDQAPPESDSGELARAEIPAALKQVGGTLLQSGYYFFPQGEDSDLRLNLSDYPLLEMADGRRFFLLETGQGLPQGAEKIIRSFWESMSIIHLEREATGTAMFDKILRNIYGEELLKTLTIPNFDKGIKLTLRGDWIFVQETGKDGRLLHQCVTLVSHPEEHTSAALKDYLAKKDVLLSDLLPEHLLTVFSSFNGETAASSHRTSDSEQVKSKKPSIKTIDTSKRQTYVAELVKQYGHTYERSAPLSFRYAGTQVKTNADLIHGRGGLDIVVDFGTFYGDTASAIESGGLKVLSIRPGDDPLAIAANILDLIGVNYTQDPVFFGADREVFKTTSMTVAGLLAYHPDRGKTLFAAIPLDPRLCDFLVEKEISIVKFKSH